jgi:transposase
MTPDDSRQPTVDELQERIRSLEKQLERALAEIERLRKELEEALRRQKRQAAPFSRGKRKEKPKRPGRKGGLAYGQQARRPIPDHIDEQITVPLPKRCGCGGKTIYDETQNQYQEDIVRKTVVRRFDVEIGHCSCCGRRIQGRHALQTSDALGAAGVQIGPEALSLAAHLRKEMGLSDQRAARVLELGWGFELSRSGVCRAVIRIARKAAPTYEQLRIVVRQADVAWMDETGWRVAATLQWLWGVVSETVTVYDILPGRGFEQASSLLGADWEGWLHHDGWKVYYQFLASFHQSCLNHLLTRCRDLIENVSPAAAQFPFAVRQLLHKGLELRDRFAGHDISAHGLAVATGQIESAMEELIWRNYRTEANRRLAKHLRHEQPWLFTFLKCPGIHATNNVAERAMRPAVIARKTWGGNRTETGAESQKILMSVLATCRQQGKDSFQRLTDLLRSPLPTLMDIVAASPSLHCP